MIIAFDYGTTKIGVAVGQKITQTARPLALIPVLNNQPDWQAITQLIEQWQPSDLVVGLALNDDLTESKTAEKTRVFAQALTERFNRPVHFCNEHLSSHAARAKAGEYPKDTPIDAIAATIILESWLEGDTNVG